MENRLPFIKYQALGNDYLIIEPGHLAINPPGALAREICDRHYGVGGDGLLIGPLPSQVADFKVRIFNPDGSEAEKSGNGLRILACYLWEHQRVKLEPFTIETAGGVVRCKVFDGGRLVQVEMGRAVFLATPGEQSEEPPSSIVEKLRIGDDNLEISALSLGNPHCVVLNMPATPEMAQRLGPLLENHPRFPGRTNVQLIQVINPGEIHLQIWERGAGYTLASGSSACAAASVAHRLGWCGSKIRVHMPGGELEVVIAVDGMITLCGLAQRVCAGEYWFTQEV
jgi:diaminopimelate epimerase